MLEALSLSFLLCGMKVCPHWPCRVHVKCWTWSAMPVSETLSLPPGHVTSHEDLGTDKLQARASGMLWRPLTHLEGSLGDALGICEALQGLGRTDHWGLSQKQSAWHRPRKPLSRSLRQCDLPKECSRKLEAWAGKTPSPSGRYNSSCATTSSLRPSPSLRLSSDTQRRWWQRAPCCSTVGLPHGFMVHLWCGGDTAVTRAVMPPRNRLRDPQNSVLCT